ncbi:MAG: hypothetical protein JW726_08275 [Anaerolineales bacterium]|nr:hypothetical protein [Anaerolineales bacterium]
MQPEFEAILSSDLPQAEKLTRAFQLIIQQQIAYGQREVELLQALGDEEALVKEKIKLGVMQYVNEIYAYCYLRVTGRKLTDE